MELDKLQKSAIKNLIEHCKLMEFYHLGHLSSGEVKALTDLYVELEAVDLKPYAMIPPELKTR